MHNASMIHKFNNNLKTLPLKTNNEIILLKGVAQEEKLR